MDDYNIKIDGEAAEFESGAKRNTKKGKGRFDLIEGDIMAEAILNVKDCKKISVNVNLSYGNCALVAALGGDYISAITFIMLEYKDREKDFDNYIPNILKELAIHYEKGAEIYGENNWKKGIPSESFRSSGLRHLTQYLRYEDDEPHHIAAIWNFIGIIYNNKNESNDDNENNESNT